MNISHYQFIEFLYKDLKDVAELGKQLFVCNMRSHGDYEDYLHFLYGEFFFDKNKDSYIFTHIGADKMYIQTEVEDNPVIGFIDFENNPITD